MKYRYVSNNFLNCNYLYQFFLSTDCTSIVIRNSSNKFSHFILPKLIFNCILIFNSLFFILRIFISSIFLIFCNCTNNEFIETISEKKPFKFCRPNDRPGNDPRNCPSCEKIKIFLNLQVLEESY